jgi:hypothetical protein
LKLINGHLYRKQTTRLNFPGATERPIYQPLPQVAETNPPRPTDAAGEGLL